MALLSHREVVLLLVLIAAALLESSHGQESSSRSSRREASDESTTFVGFVDRGEAVRAICDKTFSRLFDDYLEDESGTWPESGLPDLHVKPVTSKSVLWAYSTYTCRLLHA